MKKLWENYRLGGFMLLLLIVSVGLGIYGGVTGK